MLNRQVKTSLVGISFWNKGHKGMMWNGFTRKVCRFRDFVPLLVSTGNPNQVFALGLSLFSTTAVLGPIVHHFFRGSQVACSQCKRKHCCRWYVDGCERDRRRNGSERVAWRPSVEEVMDYRTQGCGNAKPNNSKPHWDFFLLKQGLNGNVKWIYQEGMSILGLCSPPRFNRKCIRGRFRTEGL